MCNSVSKQTCEIRHVNFSVGKTKQNQKSTHLFDTGKEPPQSSGTDVININIPIGHRGGLAAGLSIKHLRGTRCPCRVGLWHWLRSQEWRVELWRNTFCFCHLDELRLPCKSVTRIWDSDANTNCPHVFLCDRIRLEWMVQALTVKKVLEMVDIWTLTEPGWSLLRKTWSCSVTAWRPTLTSKVTYQWSIKHWLPTLSWHHKLITNVENEKKNWIVLKSLLFSCQILKNFTSSGL